MTGCPDLVDLGCTTRSEDGVQQTIEQTGHFISYSAPESSTAAAAADDDDAMAIANLVMNVLAAVMFHEPST
jgi:hypothetical protein